MHLDGTETRGYAGLRSCFKVRGLFTVGTSRTVSLIVARRRARGVERIIRLSCGSRARTCGTSRRIASSEACPWRPSSRTSPPCSPCSPFRLLATRRRARSVSPKPFPSSSRAAPRVVRDVARRSLARARSEKNRCVASRRARTFRRRHRSCARGKDGARRDARWGASTTRRDHVRKPVSGRTPHDIREKKIVECECDCECDRCGVARSHSRACGTDARRTARPVRHHVDADAAESRRTARSTTRERGRVRERRRS